MKNRYLFILVALFAMSTQVWGATSGSCGTDVVWNYNTSTKVLTISGSGDMNNFTHMSCPWYNYRNSITTVIIEEGVTSIGNYAFDDCSSLTKITIPASITKSGNNAYKGCTNLKTVYAASPDAWASITFDTDGGRYALPFYESTGGAKGSPSKDCKFYFGNSKTAASIITFTPNLTEIKPYAFYRAGSIRDVYLPASVTTIGAYAFDCKIIRLTTNRTTPATTGTNSFTFRTDTFTYIYLPDGAVSTYNAVPWYNGLPANTNGAQYCGYGSDTKKIQSNIPVSGRYVYPTSGRIGDINWSLSTDGVLTFIGTGELPEFNATNNSVDCIPWYRFRYLIYEAEIGEAASVEQITSIKNALKWCYALTKVTVLQSTLPEVTADGLPTSDFLGEVVEISIPMEDLNPEVLENEPWKNMDIHLSEPLVINETQDNTDLLTNCLTLSNPIDVQLIRSLSSSNYNTFCSPVTIPAADIAALLGEDAEVYAFTGVSGNAETGYTFAFSPLESDIVAGVPYLVTPGSTISQIELTNVATSRLTTTPQTVTHNGFSFCGVLAPTNLSGGEYILGDGNLLYKALPGQMKGMRAYFTLSTPSGIAPRVSVKVLNQTDTPTNWEAVHSVPKTQKMLRNGRLLIHRDGKTYDILGNKQ